MDAREVWTVLTDGFFEEVEAEALSRNKEKPNMESAENKRSTPMVRLRGLHGENARSSPGKYQQNGLFSSQLC